MPRYLVMVQWGAGLRYQVGPKFTAESDQAALEGVEFARIARMAREHAEHTGRGAKPHGPLLRMVKDEVPELAMFCSKCGKRLEDDWPVNCCDKPTLPIRRQVEGTGPETPYLDLREEG